MVLLVTFGTFKKKYSEKDIKKDKEIFFNCKKAFLSDLLYNITNYDFLTEEEIFQMDNIIKQKLSQNKGIERKIALFTANFGIAYNLLTKEEQKELLAMNLTYEECGKVVKKIYNNFLNKAKKYQNPVKVYLCFEEKCFIAYCQIFRNIAEIKPNNFLGLIRDYFILDKGKRGFEQYRDQDLFNIIQKDMIDMYPNWKKEYGINRYLDKFLSFFDEDNDYNNRFLKNILDNYINNNGNNDKYDKYENNNEYTPLKKKMD